MEHNKMRQAISILFLFFSTSLVCGQQKNIGQFAVWKHKEGQSTNFENGFKRHLDWHRKNADQWSWYGWYVVSGKRFGLFIDGTFDLSWSDFDRPVDPLADMADNEINVSQYASLLDLFKVSCLEQYSTQHPDGYTLDLSRLLTLDIDDTTGLSGFLQELHDLYVHKKGIKSFRTFKVIDEGNLNQLIILMGFSNWEEYSISENLLEEISALDKKSSSKVIKNVTSETLAYQKDMSYLRF